jgi:GNAT superfamily N-acetyltransferase
VGVRIAESDAEIRACFPVMAALRTDRSDEDAFLARVRLQEQTGYRLACVAEAGCVVAVAGFRIGENLAWERFLYVDDLVTLPEARSRGHGKALLDWLADHARSQGCRQLHLDSGTHRTDAHRFYGREGFSASSLHFRRDL